MPKKGFQIASHRVAELIGLIWDDKGHNCTATPEDA